MGLGLPLFPTDAPTSAEGCQVAIRGFRTMEVAVEGTSGTPPARRHAASVELRQIGT